ncbi:YrhK family protein [Nocardiopsis coralliicola]
MPSHPDDSGHPHDRPVAVHIGRHELLIRRRYEAASIANDILIALWFIAGSILFFSPAHTAAGTWCFLAGSVELLVRPLIRASRQIHIQQIRARGSAPSAPGESSGDF